MIDVLVVGDANPDLILTGDVVPRFGQEEQLLQSADMVLGGSAAITAHALARLGRTTRLCAVTGSDTFGGFVAEKLRAAGVDTAALTSIGGVTTGLTLVLSNGDERAILTYPGAIPMLTAGQVAASITAAAADGSRHLHVAAFFLLGPVTADLPELLRQAHALGLTTSLDTNYDPHSQWWGMKDTLAEVDYFLPNRAEALAMAAQLAGRPVVDMTDAASSIARHGPTVVVKDGPHGAHEFRPDGSAIHEPGTAVEPVDTTGAGDTFNAAYLDSLLHGHAPPQRLRRAAAAGALSTLAVGGTAAQPTHLQLLHTNEG